MPLQDDNWEDQHPKSKKEPRILKQQKIIEMQNKEESSFPIQIEQSKPH